MEEIRTCGRGLGVAARALRDAVLVQALCATVVMLAISFAG